MASSDERIGSNDLHTMYNGDVFEFHKLWNSSNDFKFSIDITDNSFNDNFVIIEKKRRKINYVISISERLFTDELNNGLLTLNTFAWVFCHELGHILGGFPVIDYRLGRSGSSFEYPITVEAQADYYSTAVCLKKFYQIKITKLKPSGY